MKHKRFPTWALPRLDTVGLDYRSIRGRLGGQQRAINLTPQQLRQIALKAVKARMEKMTPEARSNQARAAGAAGNAKRWANHVRKYPPRRNPRGWNAAQAGKAGAIARWGARA